MICLHQVGGSVIQSAPTDPCEFVALTVAEFNQINTALASTDTDFYNLLVNVFATPSTEQIIAAFMAAFSLPVLAYMVARSYGLIINWFGRG